jgi:cell division transport system permease protein
MRAWLRHHRRALAAALRKLAAQKSAALMSALVIGIALSLPTGGYVLIESLRPLVRHASLDPHLSLFLGTDVKRSDAESLGARLRADARLAAVRFVSREAALQELRETEGLGDLVEALERNPLPDAFVLRARDPAPETVEALAADLRSLPGVVYVQVDSAWARRLAALGRLARLGLALVAGLLAFGLVAVTFNTIRLQILTQRDEISVSKLIGASDAFVQRPFFYLGILQGSVGGLFAIAIVWLGTILLNLEVASLASSYGSTFRITLLSPADAAGVLLFAGALGWLGAYLCVSRYLREIDPL